MKQYTSKTKLDYVTIFLQFLAYKENVLCHQSKCSMCSCMFTSHTCIYMHTHTIYNLHTQHYLQLPSIVLGMSPHHNFAICMDLWECNRIWSSKLLSFNTSEKRWRENQMLDINLYWIMLKYVHSKRKINPFIYNYLVHIIIPFI